MTIAEEIQAWRADGGDYDLGVSIYRKYGKIEVLKKRFVAGKGQINWMKKLHAELAKIERDQSGEKAVVSKLKVIKSPKMPFEPEKKKHQPLIVLSLKMWLHMQIQNCKKWSLKSFLQSLSLITSKSSTTPKKHAS